MNDKSFRSLALCLLLVLAPAISWGKLKPKAKSYHIKALVLVEPSGPVSLIVNPLRRTSMTIDVQNPSFVRQSLKQTSYVGVVDVDMDFYWTARKQPTALIKKISNAKDERLPAYDGNFQ
ncbi:MAG: hypothetical protein KF789_07205 [Bdellovibrionaceae bacterium]|nr:hypothetical protein [Pseudobdellovibrionaceae bacterium]